MKNYDIKIPASQRLWATYFSGNKTPQWAICSDQARVKWYLYNLEGDKPRKVKTGKSPKDFEEEVGHI